MYYDNRSIHVMNPMQSDSPLFSNPVSLSYVLLSRLHFNLLISFLYQITTFSFHPLCLSICFQSIKIKFVILENSEMLLMLVKNNLIIFLSSLLKTPIWWYMIVSFIILPPTQSIQEIVCHVMNPLFSLTRLLLCLLMLLHLFALLELLYALLLFRSILHIWVRTVLWLSQMIHSWKLYRLNEKR